MKHALSLGQGDSRIECEILKTETKSSVWVEKCKHTFGDKHLFWLQTVNEISLLHKMNHVHNNQIFATRPTI